MQWNRKNAHKDLRAVQEVFDKHAVRLVLVYGTCLGFVRDKNFIKWDDDIDLAVVDKIPLQKKYDIYKDLEKLGFTTQPLLWYIQDKKELKETDENNWRLSEDNYIGDDFSGIIAVQRYVKVSIFFFGEKGEKLLCIPVKGCWPLMETPKGFFEKLDIIKYKGHGYFIPSPVRGYLNYIYANWRKKDRSEHGKIWTEQKTEKELLEYSRSTFGTKRKDS